MAKFCTKCGTPLVEGKCPQCEPVRPQVEIEEKKVSPVEEVNETKEPEVKAEEAQEAVESQEVETEESFAREETEESVEQRKVVKKVIRKKIVRPRLNILEFFLEVLKAPVTSMERIVNEVYLQNALIIGLVQAVLISLGVCVMLHSLVKSIYGAANNIINSYGNSYGLYGNNYNIANYMPQIPYVEIFIKIAIILVISEFVFVLINWGLLSGVGKVKLSFKSSFCAAVGYMVPMTLGGALTVILGFVNPAVGVVALAVMSTIATFMYTCSIMGIKEIRKNACVWIAFLTILLSGMVSTILISGLLGSFVGQFMSLF